LLASLAESGQQTPIVVVAAAGQPDRYLVIDGYKRIAALRQLGRDIVEAEFTFYKHFLIFPLPLNYLQQSDPKLP
jgi:hypothetical protein